MNFLHNFLPQPILFEWGFITVRFYGLIIAMALVACFSVALYLARKRNIDWDDLYDLAFYLALGGIVGARLYDVFLIEWNYFGSHPWEMLAIWHGGLAIHGAIIGGVISLIVWCKIKKKSFWQFAGLLFTVLPLGQAIGRWGNYFNQELFGGPTTFLWGIPISLANRPEQYLNYQYFQPAFLYESILDFVLFLILFFWYKKNRRPGEMIIFYLMGYSVIRFLMEFVRIDVTSLVFGVRLPQLVSAVVFVVCAGVLIFRKFKLSSSKS
jgi:phosphatidylglycerol:prolipoprotein diacylglycerol transferase